MLRCEPSAGNLEKFALTCRNCIKCAWIPTYLQTKLNAHTSNLARTQCDTQFSPQKNILKTYIKRESLQLISSGFNAATMRAEECFQNEWSTNICSSVHLYRRSCTVSHLRSVKVYTTRTCAVLNFDAIFSVPRVFDRYIQMAITWLCGEILFLWLCEWWIEFLATPEIDDASGNE